MKPMDSFASIRERFKKALEYLFMDYEFISEFEERFNYESYWQKRVKKSGQNSLTMERLFEAQEYLKFKTIANLIEPKSKVLDIGCGDGSLLDYLAKRKEIIPFGIEISSTACNLARQKGIKVLEMNIIQEPLPLTFDYIIMCEVLEHLANSIEVLLKLKGNFTKRLLVEIPNTGALSERFRLLFGRFPKQWILHPDEHLHFWTVTDFLFLCKQLGFTVNKYYGLYDAYFDLGPVKLWKHYPKLFTRYILYELSHSRNEEQSLA